MAHDNLVCFYFLSSIFFFGLSSSNSISFQEGFDPLYGEQNVVPYDEANTSVRISMDETTSSGFHSKLTYTSGRFETSLKLPRKNYTAGVVVTFYMSNADQHPSSHDEIDFEFLGHVHGQKWAVQTNFYGNGSTSRGREERYELPFDPSADFHRYGILWTEMRRITFYVDGVPIRHVAGDVAGEDFPSKAMRVYGTIWDGSSWATEGGLYKVDHRYGPFVAEYSGFLMGGGDWVGLELGREEQARMEGFRRRWMTYSYCYDKKRYAVALPECVFEGGEFERLRRFDPWTFGSSRK
ncbi:xyloglucan endotransglucosylase/hydrolase 28 [Striga asiatica]|uniref:Xyloglucan endotransglucosylase/hydrolase n=1 Tax=Striga asiatica TaxID=4170 RepID=A0A5A7PX95_STRAF|nr:xyloglucan endotransglucosylase/hydrolase 28 [Striga asiatica]